jgi:segregation and condensation protein B
MTSQHPAAGEELLRVVESILFVAYEPVDVGTLGRAVRRPADAVEQALAALAERHSQGGIRLQRNGGHVQLVSAPESGPYVERYLGLERSQRLSGAALESLAIIAYKQPITRAGIEAVRGVNSDGAVAALVGRGLIEEVGRVAAPGRPVLFGTTMKFLEHFGLSHPSELPPLGPREVVEEA